MVEPNEVGEELDRMLTEREQRWRVFLAFAFLAAVSVLAAL